MSKTEKRMLIFGGTFDPIHIGHLIIANRIRESYLFDKVYFLPTGTPPHKKITTTKEDRLLLLKLGIQDNKDFEVLDNEILKDGISYTIDTIKEISKKYNYPKITFIMGADMFMSIEKWKKPKELLSLIDIIVATRQDARIKKQKEFISKKYSVKVSIFSEIETSINSSYIREKIKQYESIQYIVPDNVRLYIEKNNLYINPEDVIFNRMMKDIESNVSKKRYQHTQGVISTALEIGAYHNIPFGKIRLAACGHDYAKEFNNDDMQKYIDENNIDVDIRAKNDINLMHGLISSIIMKNMYEINDQEVLDAAQNHTFGKIGMTDLELLVSIADVVEPSREYDKKQRKIFDNIKKVAEVSLTDAYYLKLRETVKYLKSKNIEIDDTTLEVVKYYKNLYENKGDLNDTI